MNNIKIQEIEDHVLTTIDAGALFPKESYMRNIVTSMNIKKVDVSCGCVTVHFKPFSRVIRVKWKMMKEFPFQVKEDRLGTQQTITVTHDDDTVSKVKLTGILLNPKKW